MRMQNNRNFRHCCSSSSKVNRRAFVPLFASKATEDDDDVSMLVSGQCYQSVDSSQVTTFFYGTICLCCSWPCHRQALNLLAVSPCLSPTPAFWTRFAVLVFIVFSLRSFVFDGLKVDGLRSSSLSKAVHCDGGERRGCKHGTKDDSKSGQCWLHLANHL